MSACHAVNQVPRSTRGTSKEEVLKGDPGAITVPAIIDVEASGFGSGSYPIEVGVALPDGSAHCFLIKPKPDWTHWDPEAEVAHGIPRHILEGCGRPAAEVARSLNGLLPGMTVYSDGWGFDMAWLALLYDSVGIRQGFQVEDLRALLSERQMQGWAQAKRQVMREFGLRRHRASADACVLQRTFLRTLGPLPG